MRFVIINPRTQQIRDFHAPDIRDAYLAAGLDPVRIDHGYLRLLRLGYVVYEFGLFEPLATQTYFGMCGRLIAGDCVLYGVDADGETIDVERVPDVRFFGNDLDAIERAFAATEVQRPTMSANGTEIWRWPNPAPEGMAP
jgi:hypothetical protein